MTNVTAFPRKRKERKPRDEGRAVFFAECAAGPGGPWILAQIEDHVDKAVVRVMPLKTDPPNAPKRKYVVDTVLEGFRLAYRVHGIHDALIQRIGPDNYRVHIPPVLTGSDAAQV